MGLKAKVGDEGSRINRCGFGSNTRGERQVFLDELLKGGGIRASDDSEDVGDVAWRFAFLRHGMRDFSGRNLESLLRGRKPEVVERLSGLGEGENDLGLLASLALGGEGRGGTFGGFVGVGTVVFHDDLISSVVVLKAELPLAGQESSEATGARKIYFALMRG